MADFFCDHGSYGGTNRIGLDIPAWGVPQEGDGTAATASTVASTVSINLTSITSNAGTISIFGSSAISVGASASGATLAAQIVSAINASSSATANTNLPANGQVRNTVFARNTGATLEIMCRIGSASLNVLGIVWGGTWTSAAPSNLTFSGGVGGCYGYLLNTAAIGVSNSIAVCAYGILKAVPMCRTAILTINDQVWVRTGNNPTLAYSGTSLDLRRGVDYTAASAYPLNLIFDTNTKWTGDSAVGTCTFNFTLSSTFSLPGLCALTNNQNCAAYSSSFGALRDGGVVFNITATTNIAIQLGAQNGTAQTATTNNQNHMMFGVHVFDNSSVSYAARLISPTTGTGGGSSQTGEFVYRRCRFVRTNGYSGASVCNFVIGNNTVVMHRLRFVGCSFESNVSGASVNPIVDISTANANPYFGTWFIFQQCNFTGFSGGGNKFPLHNTTTSISGGQGFKLEAIDCTGVALASAYAGITQSAAFASDPDLWHILLHSPLIGGAFRYENYKGICEFDPGASPAQPTLSAVQPSGSAWSIHARWLAAVNAVTLGSGFRIPPLRASYVASTGVRTIKAGVFLSSALFSALVKGDFVATLSYVSDTTGSVVSVSQLIPSASSSSWTGSSGYGSHVAKEFSFTTADSVRQGTEVVIQIELSGSPRSGSAESVFIDPELSIT